MRRPVLLCAALALGAIIAPAPAATAAVSPEHRFHQLINEQRAARGLPALRFRNDLSAVAERHSERMQAAADIWHNPKLASQIPGSWVGAGENVGVGFDVDGLHAAFMASRNHRVNIMRARFDDIGLGVVTNADGEVYVTQVFVDRGALTIAAKPKPAPKPATKPAEASSDDSDAGTGDGVPDQPTVKSSRRAPFDVVRRTRVDRRNVVELLIRIVSTR